jgi:hypothetical protein
MTISDNGARAMLDTEDTNNPNFPLRGSNGAGYDGLGVQPKFQTIGEDCVGPA